LREALRDSKDIDRIVDGVRQSLDFIKTLDPNVAKTVRDCYGWATNKGFGFLIGVVFFAFVSSLFIRERSLSR
jgi:tetrahydromethanopterin S-methyltransferase subunit B